MDSKEKLFLVHSFPTNSILLDGLIKYLGSFFDVIPIDLPGFTREVPPLDEIQLEGYYRHVAKKIEGTLPLEHYLVAGISFGFQVVNSIPHDYRCKGIIAMEPYLGLQSVRISWLFKMLASILVKSICTLHLSDTVWKSRLFKAYLSKGAPPERVRTVLEEIDSRTFFGTIRALLRDRSEVTFHKIPYVLVANPDDTTIDYEYVHAIFTQQAEVLLVETTPIPHYPQEITQEYFRERIPEELVQRILGFVAEQWRRTAERRPSDKSELFARVAKSEQYGGTAHFPRAILDHLSLQNDKYDFQNANLVNASLRGALLDNCSLAGAVLTGADLSPAMGGRRTSLKQAKLPHADLQDANLQDADLRGANLQDANLQDADLRGANLGKADLRGANLKGANLFGADLTGADLTNTILQEADLRQVNLKEAVLSGTQLRRDSLGRHLLQEREMKYDEARLIYVALKRNFEALGDYGAASWAYVRERIMYRHTYWLPYVLESRFHCPRGQHDSRRPRAIWTIGYYVRHGWRWFSPRHDGKWIRPYALKWVYSFTVGTLTGYGEQPWNAIYLAISAILLHAFLYMASGGIATSAGGTPAFGDYFIYSLGAFCTMTFDDLQAITPLAQVLTSLEAIAGVTSLAVFTAALSQRIGSR